MRLSKMSTTFINDCVAGIATLDDLDNYIEYWHKNQTGTSLQKFLGLSAQEYENWVKDSNNYIENIIEMRKTFLFRINEEHSDLRETFANRFFTLNLSTKQIAYNELYNDIYFSLNKMLDSNSLTNKHITILLKNKDIIKNIAEAFDAGNGKTVEEAIIYMATNTEERISSLIKIAEYEKKGFDFPNKDEYSDNHLNNLSQALEDYKNQGYSDEATVYLAKEKAKYLDIESMGINSSMKLDDIKNTVKKHAGIIPFEELITKDFVIIDTESTGYSNDDEIVELGVIDKNSSILFESMFKPQKEISQEAFNVNGIHNSELNNKPTFSEQWENIKQVLEGKIIVTYNRDFDKRIMLQTCQKQGIDIKEVDKLFENSICAMQSYTEHKGHYKATKLNEALSEVGVIKVQTHRAVDDCFDTLRLIKKCAFVSEHQLSKTKPTLSPFPPKRESTVKIGTTLNKRANTNIIKTEKEKSNGISPTASFISY